MVVIYRIQQLAWFVLTVIAIVKLAQEVREVIFVTVVIQQGQLHSIILQIAHAQLHARRDHLSQI